MLPALEPCLEPTGECLGVWVGVLRGEAAAELRPERSPLDFPFCLREVVLPLSRASLRRSLSCILSGICVCARRVDIIWWTVCGRSAARVDVGSCLVRK